MKEIKLNIKIKYHYNWETRWAYRGSKRIPVYHYANITRVVTVDDGDSPEANLRPVDGRAWSLAFDYIWEKYPGAEVDSVRHSVAEQ